MWRYALTLSRRSRRPLGMFLRVSKDVDILHITLKTIVLLYIVRKIQYKRDQGRSHKHSDRMEKKQMQARMPKNLIQTRSQVKHGVLQILMQPIPPHPFRSLVHPRLCRLSRTRSPTSTSASTTSTPSTTTTPSTPRATTSLTRSTR